MGRRAAIFVALALACLLGIVAWIALREEARPSAVGAPALERTSRAERAPAPLSAAPATAAREEAESPAEPSTVPDEPALDAAGPERWLLEGRVVGDAPERWSEGQIVIEWTTPSVPTQQTKRFPITDSSFSVDLGFMTHDPSPGPSLTPGVGVRLEHPALKVDFGAFSPNASILRRGADGRTERVSTVVLVARSGATLIGRIVDERGAPVPGAVVGLLEGPGSSAPDRWLAETHSDARGEFVLSVFSSGAGLLLVDAVGRLPLARPIDALTPGSHDLGTFVAEEGAVLEGCVEGVGAGFLVVARLDTAFSGEARPGGRDLAWRGDRPLRARVEVFTAGEGRFRMTGLAAEPHHVEVARGSSSEGCTLPGTASGELAVRAPAAGLVLRDQSAWLRFELRGGGETLVDGAKVTSLSLRGSCAVGPDMRATWRVPPGERLAFRAEARGHQPADIEVVAPGPGARENVVVELLAVEGARILVRVRDARTGEPVPRIRYELAGETSEIGRSSGQAGVVLRGRDGSRALPFGGGSSFAPDGRHRLGPFEPGRAALQIHAVGPWSDGRGHLLPRGLEVEVPATGLREYELALDLGGQVVVRLSTPDGRPASARLEFRDAEGGVLYRGIDLSRASRHLVFGRVPPADPELILPPLPPGSYTLELIDSDWQPATIPVRIEAGRTTTVEHVLLPR